MIIPDGFPSLPKTFEYETEVHQSTDGENGIFFNWFKRKGVAPRRGLLIIHGQGEHGGRYQHFVHYLQNHYDLILAPDLRGHGRSEGIRGHVDSFDEYVDDALLAWEVLGSRLGAEGTRDWFGHSMGGTITLRTLAYRSSIGVKNVMLSSPALDLTVKVPVVKELAARVLTKFWGSLAMEAGLDPKILSHDPNVVRAIKMDQLHHTKASPLFYFSFVDAMRSLREHPVKLPSDLRILFQLAGEDEVVSTPATEVFFSQLQHEKKDLKVYPGLFHEIFNETTKDKCFHDLIHWLKAGGA